MARKRLHIFCYDISDNKLRSRVAAGLEDKGARVQGSVFEIWLTPEQARRLGQTLGEMLDKGDSLRVYPIPTGAVKASQSYGRGAPPTDGDYYLF